MQGRRPTRRGRQPGPCHEATGRAEGTRGARKQGSVLALGKQRQGRTSRLWRPSVWAALVPAAHPNLH